MQIEKPNHIYAILMAKGLTCQSWAVSHGYKPRTVQMYINRFCPETGKKPQGEIGKKIMKDLSTTIEFNLLEKIDE